MQPRILSERDINWGKLKSPQEELAFLRKKVKEKELELNAPKNRFESDRIAKREVAGYSAIPAAAVLHDAAVMPEYETMRHVLKLEQEAHDAQIDGLLKIMAEHGIHNTLSVVARMKNPHVEEDFHRMLARYIAEGLPEKGFAPLEKVRRASHMALFEIEPQAAIAVTEKEQARMKLKQAFLLSERIYAGLLSIIEKHECFSLEIAVADGAEKPSIYLAIPRAKQKLAERLIPSVFPDVRISESRGDYNIVNYECAGAVAQLAAHPAFPLKTHEAFERSPLNALFLAFTKVAKHGEGAAVQFVVGNNDDRYNKHYEKMIREAEKSGSTWKALRIPETPLGESLAKLGRSVFFPDHLRENDAEREDQPERNCAEMIKRKVQSRITPVVIRIAASAPDKKRAEHLVGNLEATFNQYGDENGNHFVFKHSAGVSTRDFLRDLTNRRFDPHLAMPLSLREVATMFHFTAENAVNVSELENSWKGEIFHNL